MANICLNSYAFFGEPKMLQKFYDDMKEATKKEPKFLDSLEHLEKYRPWALIGLYYAAGFTDKEIKENHFNLNYGFCNLDWGKGEDETPCVWLDIETAWRPNNKDIDELVKKYPGVQVVCSAEEYDSDTYLNTDESGNFFPERYCMYWQIDGPNREFYEDGKDYMSSVKEIYQRIAEITNTTAKEVREFHRKEEFDDVVDVNWMKYCKKCPLQDGDEFLGFKIYRYYND